MAHAERVVFALLALRERRHAILLLDRVDGVAATGQDLVRIALVADVPDDAVVGGVVEIVQQGGQFDHAQASPEMASRLAHRLDQVAAQLIRDGAQFGGLEGAQVGRAVDPEQPGITGGIDHVAIVPLPAGRGNEAA